MSSPNNTDPKQKPSNIPSWIMVGFVLGALVFYTVNDYFERAKAEKAATAVTPTEKAKTPSDTTQGTGAAGGSDAASRTTQTDATKRADNGQLSLSAMDTIFRTWSVNAMWQYETTEVMFWNPATDTYSVPVEVLRSGSEYYYRLLPALTRPLIKEGARPDRLLLFTESDEATELREQKTREAWQR